MVQELKSVRHGLLYFSLTGIDALTARALHSVSSISGNKAADKSRSHVGTHGRVARLGAGVTLRFVQAGSAFIPTFR